jgi:hypothetical protein
LKAKGSGFGSEFCFLAHLKAELICGKMAVIEFLMGSYLVENDACKFVAAAVIAFGAPSLARHAAIEVAESRFAAMQGLSRHA